MPGRNDACPCGSGEKFKRCCLGSRRRASPVGLSSRRSPGTRFPETKPAEPGLFRYGEVEVTLLRVEEPPWRRFLIRWHDRLTFAHLHRSIQDACGWRCHHLYEFRRNRRDRERIGGPAEFVDPGFGTRDAWEVAVPSLLGRGEDLQQKLLYTYDFGDHWDHEVHLRGFQDRPEEGELHLLDGELAFPPEDCGGIVGYDRARELRRTGDVEIDDPEQLDRWLGPWDPDAFDLEEARATFDVWPEEAPVG